MSDLVWIYDCTLRDGTQGEHVSLTVEDKLRIARRLDEFGIHYIEGGWPGSNPKDAEFFARARQIDWKGARLTAFGSTRHRRQRAEQDPNLKALLEAETPVVAVFGKSWDLHVRRALGAELPENLAMIEESVAFLASHGREVVFDAEHFFDGYRRNPDYALEVLAAAHRGGAHWLVLCDTNGGTLPALVSRVTAELSERYPRLGIHTHNDSELAVANSIAAVEAGARMVQGTINGYGERVGNANLTSLLPVLELKMSHRTVGRERLGELAKLAGFVSETANLGLPNNLPFVGRSAFAHKGGIHVSAILKDPRTYEHIEPEQVGNRRRVLISDLSGKSNLSYKLGELDQQLAADTQLSTLLEEVKRKEYEGFQFEGAEASFWLLQARLSGRHSAPFSSDGFRVMVDQMPDGQVSVTATVKIRVGEEEEHTAAEGDGPVHALDRAFKKALQRFFPEIGNIRLTDYKVRVLDAENGTAAKVRVLIESTDGQDTWSTVGVSNNILEASWQALTDSVLYQLSLTDRRAASADAHEKG